MTNAPMNGLGIASTAGTAPTAMYRPNFSQAFQRAGPYPTLFPGQPFNASGGMLANGTLHHFIKNLVVPFGPHQIIPAKIFGSACAVID